MCFDMIMEKNNVKLNSCVRTSRRTKCVSAGLRMRSNDEEATEASTQRPPRRRGLRATVRKALRSSKATVRKQRHQKRLQVMCLVEVVDAGQKTTENGHDNNVAFTRFEHGSSPPLVPSSAMMMAPANTTQYLMSDVDEDQFDFQSTTTTTSTVSPPGLYGEDLSPSSVYVSLDNTVDYETCLAFQQRSFEAELCAYGSC